MGAEREAMEAPTPWEELTMSLGCLVRFVASMAFNKAFVELSMRS